MPHKQESVVSTLSDLKNLQVLKDRFEQVKDKLPEDKIKDLQFDSDSITVSSPMGAVTMVIVDREEPKMIKFETKQSPVPFNFWVQVLPVTPTTSKMKLTIKAELNAFIAGMVKKPLQEGIEKIADALQAIKYE